MSRDRLLAFWLKIQDYLDIKGGAAIGLWTLLMAPFCAYALYKGHDIPAGLSLVYSAVVACYAAHATFGRRKK
jgi:hypothetical protein